ncbi:MAG: pilus assembly protein N-terminal domain-containing protein [Pseudomonadota bacterium]
MIRKFLAVFVVTFVAVIPVQAQHVTRSLVEGFGEVVELPREASSIFVGDPGVTDVRVVSGKSLFLAGISPGTTNVFVLDFEDTLIRSFRVRVVANNSEAANTLRSGLRRSNITIQNNDNVAILKGQARTLDDAFAALDARRSLEGDGRVVVDRTTIAGGVQVSLKVRFVEASRSDLLEFGVDLAAFGSISEPNDLRIFTGSGIVSNFLAGTGQSGGGGITAGVDGNNIDAVLRALDSEGIVEVLSEPTLTTTSGKRANFRVGGEFGFPVNQGDGVIGVEYKEFGVSLDFLPTILPNRRIAIEVSPEVSFIEDVAAVTTENFSAPSLSVRRAETTVELASGQTFAIAGLYEQMSSNTVNSIPGLRRAPAIRNFFGNRTKIQEERELVIFITPYIAKATDVAKPNRNHQPSLGETVGFIIK